MGEDGEVQEVVRGVPVLAHVGVAEEHPAAEVVVEVQHLSIPFLTASYLLDVRKAGVEGHRSMERGEPNIEVFLSVSV